LFVKNIRSPILYADLPTSPGKSSNALSRFTGHNRALNGSNAPPLSVNARFRQEAAKVSMEDSPLQINLVFSVLIKAILDPAT
jgi:hypothetical protein